MKRVFSILIVLITLLFVAFIIQNAEMVDLTFLAWGIEISKALLMMICAAVGFLIGLLTFSFRQGPKIKQTPASSEHSRKEELD